MSVPTYSVVVPAYNEENAILDTLQHLRDKLTGDYELVVVNDASTDRTGAILDEAAASDPTLQVVHHTRNGGYGLALKSGIRHSHAPLIVITDADGTYPNERIPELVALCENQDMVVGARTGEQVTYSKLRSLAKVWLKLYASWVARQHIPDMNSGLRVFRRERAEEFIKVLPSGFSFTTTITLAMLTKYYRVLFVPIDYKPRVGKSKIRPFRDTLNFVQLILRTGMYFAPLRVFFPLILLLGTLFAISLGYDVFVARNLTDKTVMLFMFAMNASLFALLADMIDKRSG